VLRPGGLDTVPATHRFPAHAATCLKQGHAQQEHRSSKTAANRRSGFRSGPTRGCQPGKKTALQTSIDDLSKRIQEQSEGSSSCARSSGLVGLLAPRRPGRRLAAPPGPPPGQQARASTPLSRRLPAPTPRCRPTSRRSRLTRRCDLSGRAARGSRPRWAPPGPRAGNRQPIYWGPKSELKLR